MSMNLLDVPFYLLFFATLAYVAVTRGYYLVLVVSNLMERLEEAFRQDSQDLELVLHSRFTIPVSVLLHSDGPDESTLSWSLDSLLHLNYPEYEVIVVYDRPEQPLSPAFLERYGLAEQTYFFSRILPTRQLRSLLRSRLFNQLTVVVKESDTEWDAFNAGINLSRYRYVLPVSASMRLEPNALLNLIRPALNNPREVMAVSAPVAVHLPNEDDPSSTIPQLLFWPPSSLAATLQRYVEKRLWLALQLLEQLRNSLMHRFAWRHRRLLVGGLGGLWGDCELVLWRKDMLLQLGGFASGGALELSLRLYHHCCKQAVPCQLRGINEAVARQDAVKTLHEFIIRRGRAWLNLRSTMRKHRKWMLSWEYGKEYKRDFGLLGVTVLPFLGLEAAVGHWVELAVFTLLPLGALCGALPWEAFLLLFAIMAGTSLLAGLLSLNLYLRHDHQPTPRRLATLLFAAVVDYLGFQQLCKALKIPFAKKQHQIAPL